MSQAGGPSGEVGRINVAFTGDASGAVAASKQAKAAMLDVSAAADIATQKVHELGGKGRTFRPGNSQGVYQLEESRGAYQVVGANEAIAKSNEKVSETYRRAGEHAATYGDTLRSQVAPIRDWISGVRQQVGVMTGLISSFAAVGAVMFTAYKIGEQVSDVLFKNTRRTRELEAAQKEALKTQEALNEAQRKSIEQQFAAAGKTPEQASAAVSALRSAEERLAAERAAPSTREQDPRYIRARGGGLRLFRAGVDPDSQALDASGNPFVGQLPLNEAASASVARREALRRIESASQESRSNPIQRQMLSEQKATNSKLDRSIQRYIGF